MTKRLSRIAPLQAGIVLGILYGFLSLIVVPFLFIAMLIGSRGGGHGVPFGLVFVIFLPILYVAAGFIGGVIAAALYNLIAAWTGGLELDVSDVSAA